MPRAEPVAHLSELRAALSSAAIQTRYQPIVRLRDREPVALEALVRLNHPIRGTLLPGHFLPQLEDAGLAAQLTELVARHAFRDMASPSLAPYCLDIALNFPLDVLLVPASIQMLDAEHRAAGIPAARVIIELTESQPVEDLVALRRATERLRAGGYRVAIDDVEPSIRHLEQLLDLPFNSVKLDKVLVQQLESDSETHAFTLRLIDAAQRRDLTVIAEGVETAATWERLTQLGVELAQGFFAARPLLPVAVPIWLRRWGKGRHFG